MVFSYATKKSNDKDNFDDDLFRPIFLTEEFDILVGEFISWLEDSLIKLELAELIGQKSKTL